MERPGEIFAYCGTEKLHDRVRRQSASNVASAMTTHPIRNDVQPLLTQNSETVLIVVALQSDVANSGCYGTHSTIPSNLRLLLEDRLEPFHEP